MGFRSSKNYVNGMSSKELGNALYHIARHTNVSKKYTQEFITNVLLRASEIVSLIEDRKPYVVWEKWPEEVLRTLDKDIINRAIVEDWTLSETDDYLTELEKFMMRRWQSPDPFRTRKDGIACVGIEDDAPVPDFTKNWSRNKRKSTD